jgi:hypothetical protein
MPAWPLLVPLTDEAKSALEDRDCVEIDRLRAGIMDGRRFSLERREGDTSPRNDLFLNDRGSRLHVSREHLQIDVTAGGEVRVYDLGSICGTRVDGHAIGGKAGPGSVPLKNDSEIVIGTSSSPYRFAVRHLERFRDMGGRATGA